MLKVEYIAGFFDGEGSIGIYRNGRGTFHLRTQLTQNITPATEDILSELCDRFGGNLSRMRSPLYQRNAAFNWQLNGNRAAAFLREILHSLYIKRDQAEIAIAWQAQHLPPLRDKQGRMTAHPRNAPIDVGAERILKALKKSYSLDDVMAAQADLVDIVHTLVQVVCVKG